MYSYMINSYALFLWEHSDESAKAMKLYQAQPIVIIIVTHKIAFMKAPQNFHCMVIFTSWICKIPT